MKETFLVMTDILHTIGISCSISHMNIFRTKNKTWVKWVWRVMVILVIASMVLLFAVKF
jgi:uncharacterized ion transporter superfamily protein YfcC